MTIEPRGGLREGLKRVLSTIDWTRVRAVAKDSLEIAPKLAAPAAVIVAALVAQSFQSSMTVSQLLSQREQSDTQIRAEMFKAITERLLESKGSEAPAPERKAVFTELLALNFHEHIELKPLLSEVDNALLEKRKQAGLTKERISVIDGQREEMRSVARRVRARQTAMLERAAPPERTWGAWAPWARAAEAERKFQDGDLRFIGVRFSGPRAPEFSANDRDVPGVVACDVPKEEGYNVCALEPVIENAPDNKAAIAVSLTGADWERQTFTVLVKRSGRFDSTAPLPPADEKAAGKPAPPCGTDQKDRSLSAAASTTGSSVLEFQTSWFDFPLTDNTLLSTGSRYSVYVDQVCYGPDQAVKAVRLGLLWFPRDYFPARERPTNYRQLREKLRLPSVRE